jgi:transcriptional/translational regulatory protein YebC/TACO1
LPNLPQTLKNLNCSNNKLIFLSNLPETVRRLNCSNNPIYKIVNSDSNYEIDEIINSDINYEIDEIINSPFSFGYDTIKIIKNIKILNNFRHLYYSLKFKKQLRKWLWEKVREPNIKKMYNPTYLIENLKEEDDLDKVLNNWN